MKILVVDDSRNERYLLETILRANDYDVVSTVNGAAALKQLRAEPFDMIISDVLMPVMDGFQLCREVRGDERLKGIPFVFYTATYTDERDEELAMKVGGDRFMRRPMEPEVFTNVIRNIVQEIEEGKIGGGERGVETESVEEFKLYSERLVTKLEKKALELKEVSSALAISNAELERFAYTLSHDLKSPLITIRGFIALLGEDIDKGDRERVKQDIERINTAAAQMDVLLASLLEISRIGRMAVASEAVSLGEIVDDAVKHLSWQIEKGRVTVDITPNLPTITADRRRIGDLFYNLLENAVKFLGEQKEPRIEVSMLEKEGEIVYCVTDNGIGIDPRYHGRIFDLYEQLDPKSEGSGIGLAMVKRIVDLHRGRVWVESEGEGKGSTFCFALPQKKAIGEDGGYTTLC